MKWDYLSIRCSFKGLGVTQEFSSLDYNGERLDDSVWTSQGGQLAKTLPEHYLTFKRPKEDAPVLG